jgi:hypothetical protein
MSIATTTRTNWAGSFPSTMEISLGSFRLTLKARRTRSLVQRSLTI